MGTSKEWATRKSDRQPFDVLLTRRLILLIGQPDGVDKLQANRGKGLRGDSSIDSF